MRGLDAIHLRKATILLENFGLTIRRATRDEDISGIADLFIVDGDLEHPIACKRRGPKSKADINQTLASAANPSKILEAGCAGGKLAMIDFRNEQKHIFLELPSQSYIDSLMPSQEELTRMLLEPWDDERKYWEPFSNGYGGCRRESEGSPVRQAVLFIPRESVTIHREWSYEEANNIIQSLRA